MERADPLSGRRVLVVDDEPYIRKLLAFKLRTAGLLPLEAADGEAALAAAAAQLPDAILLDVSLPSGLTGFDVLRRLKEDPRTAPVPVVFLTARVSPEERATGLGLGAARFLTKPFSTKALLEELSEVLAAAGKTAEQGGPPPLGEGPPGTRV